ncbi:MAG: hypothetical protein HN778_05085 [Prolixibacteraceae bacterium]|jgi:hypothetical protein|nr:hypothetical protein [Prolixibacteraceae bacterium]MBT6006550.1 hypothetical protein [Prolixibacteraceae bacterium]MBT6766753.1 hypothetical protein [Prolixibacteraceae bacterium]MBT6998863.1 hypothetical protein [Prolixibacteraceae bacterium]MBT7394192.1 hypothetical protein [Prolixibacteraceae bacterium]
MTKQEKLLNKYYNGETSLDEEKELKKLFLNDMNHNSEHDIFGYFENEKNIPVDLEENIFVNLETKVKKRKTIRMRLYSLSSAAAVIIIFLSVYLDFRDTKTTQIENDFFVMEQALFQISESIQPKEQEEMLVLWVDDNVEIIIN